MKHQFIINSADLKAAIKRLSYSIIPRPTIPALENIKMIIEGDIASLITSDGEMTITADVRVTPPDKPLSLLVPYEFIKSILQYTGVTPISFVLDNKDITVSTDGDRYIRKGLEEVNIFPVPSKSKKLSIIELMDDELAALQTAIATVGKEGKMSYVLLEIEEKGITVASSDGSYLIYSNNFEGHTGSSAELLLPVKAIKALTGAMHVKVFYNDEDLCISADGFQIRINRLQERYAKFRSIFPPDFTSNLTVNRLQLILAIEKTLLSRDGLKTVKFDLSDKKNIKLIATDDFGQEIIIALTDCEYTGPVSFVHLSANFLLKLLNQVDYEVIELAIHDHMRPVLLRSPESAGYLAFLMSINKTN